MVAYVKKVMQASCKPLVIICLWIKKTNFCQVSNLWIKWHHKQLFKFAKFRISCNNHDKLNWDGFACCTHYNNTNRRPQTDHLYYISFLFDLSRAFYIELIRRNGRFHHFFIYLFICLWWKRYISTKIYFIVCHSEEGVVTF